MRLQKHLAEEAQQASAALSGSAASDFLRDAIEGLSQPQKSIPGKYLWDETGSSIFDQICHSDSYYPTRRESALITRAVSDVAQIIGPKSCLVEIGSGASHKIRILLDALSAPRRYVAIDISSDFLNAATQRLRQDYPALDIMEVCADYSLPLPTLPIERSGKVLGLFLGTSICNVDRHSAKMLLTRTREALGTSWLLIGQDPNTNPDTIAKAYGGPLMAAFHKNVLERMKRELGAHIDVDHFQHEARFFDNPARTEPHLVATQATTIAIGDRAIEFAAGESIRTDVSWKYSKPDFLALLAEAGWTSVQSWMDDDGLYGLHLLHSRQ